MKSANSEPSRITRTTQTNARRLPRWIYVGWALPVSMFAIFLLPLAIRRARWRVAGGALEVTSPALGWFLRSAWARTLSGGNGFAAATIGSVIVASDVPALEACRTHERVHVRQCERWGLLFPIAYVAAGLWCALTRRQWQSYYWDNPFEVEARAAEAFECAAASSRPTSTRT
jgi:hypothetical protein